MTSEQQRVRRAPVAVAGDVLLWLAAIGGVICIVVVLAAVLFHVTLILFKTGSMEPTIPTGSLAVVQQIPASRVSVGDIVTVDRAGELPITHRVTSVSGSGATRTITMRGDANPTDDPAPYQVSRVRLTWFWIPGWARVIVWFSNPFVLGGITIGVAALVTWAFWPRDDRRGRRRAAGRRRRSGSSAATIAGASSTTLLVAGLIAVGAMPAPARAAEVETMVSSSYFQLTSISDPELLNSMAPLVPVTWQVGVVASAPEPGQVHVGLAASGALATPGRISVQVSACRVRWVAGACSSGASTWLPPTDLASAIMPATEFGARKIGSMSAATPRWLLLSLTRLSGAAVPGSSFDLRVQVWGEGDALATAPTSLAATGPAPGSVLPPAGLALMAIGVGVALPMMVRWRRRREVDDD